ncbi:membrane protein, partial [Pseudomonas syringae pv. theae ICMP 3923]
VIGGHDVGILDKSAAYWKARGNAVWGDAIRGFRGSMVAMGGFGLAAVALELFDVVDDFYAGRPRKLSATPLPPVRCH